MHTKGQRRLPGEACCLAVREGAVEEALLGLVAAARAEAHKHTCTY
jgi:hypothetical protein